MNTTKSPSIQIETYGSAPIFQRIAKALAKRQRHGFIPAGWDATTDWKRHNAEIFN